MGEETNMTMSELKCRKKSWLLTQKKICLKLYGKDFSKAGTLLEDKQIEHAFYKFISISGRLDDIKLEYMTNKAQYPCICGQCIL